MPALRVSECALLTSLKNGLKLCRKCTSLFAISYIEHTNTRATPVQSLGMLALGRDGWNCFLMASRLLLGLVSVGCFGGTAL